MHQPFLENSFNIVLSFIKKIFKSKTALNETPSSLSEFLGKLDISTTQPELYERALTHGSFVKKQVDSNERLEFVGDAILGAATAHILFNFFPNKNEGKLSKMRSKLVSREALNQLGNLLEIPKYLKHSIGKNEFRINNNYIGNAFEALIGAIYLDKGYDYTYRFIEEKIIKPFTDLEEIDERIKDFKSYIIIWAQQTKRIFEFKVSRNQDSQDELRFIAKIFIDGEEIAEGKGRNKKNAQQEAAKKAIKILDI